MNETYAVIVVEDDEERLLDRVACIESDGRFEVTAAGLASEACERLAESAFDAILLDLTLPDDWGLDALLRIRSQAPDLPVIVVVDPEDEPWGEEAVFCGADGWVGSSDECERLRQALAEASERGRQARSTPRPRILPAESFATAADSHLRLAAAAGRELLLCQAVAGLASVAGWDDVDREIERLMSAAFRLSDLIAKLDRGRYLALAIVHQGDNADEVLTARMDELLHAANAALPARLELDFTVRRLAPVAAEETIAAALPPATTRTGSEA